MSVKIKKIKGGLTAPKGFFAGAIHCGLKRSGNDLCLIYSHVPANASGVFTANRIKAAPLLVSMSALKKGAAQAIIANSGNANCMTGKEGSNDAKAMAASVASLLGIKPGGVLTASTGVIGRRLPIKDILLHIAPLILCIDSKGSGDAAKAIMTTDTVPKETAVSLRIGSKEIRIGAIAKGAGMIHPNMATMLSFITTDADIAPAALKMALKEAVAKTFNCITIDGDTSTNDCVLMLANGLAKNRRIRHGTADYNAFKAGLEHVCGGMAAAIVADAEGATKFVKVSVKHAASIEDAKKVAVAIATSPLVKTALFGGDPNWGRIAAAAGRSGAIFYPAKLDIALNGIIVLKKGAPGSVDREKLKASFKKRDIDIELDMRAGAGKSQVLTCDLSKRYIDINAHYTT